MLNRFLKYMREIIDYYKKINFFGKNYYDINFYANVIVKMF